MKRPEGSPPPRPWAADVEPTPEQAAEYVRTIPMEWAVYLFRRLMDLARDGEACWTANHVGRLLAAEERVRDLAARYDVEEPS